MGTSTGFANRCNSHADVQQMVKVHDNQNKFPDDHSNHPPTPAIKINGSRMRLEKTINGHRDMLDTIYSSGEALLLRSVNRFFSFSRKPRRRRDFKAVEQFLYLPLILGNFLEVAQCLTPTHFH